MVLFDVFDVFDMFDAFGDVFDEDFNSQIKGSKSVWVWLSRDFRTDEQFDEVFDDAFSSSVFTDITKY